MMVEAPAPRSIQDLEPSVLLYFRDRLRDARASAQRDAEGFTAIVQVVEELGKFIEPKANGLGQLRTALTSVARESSLAKSLQSDFKPYFGTLLELVRDSRNDYAHEGACARHITRHAAELSLVLEDAMNHSAHRARDFMVPNPIFVAPWQPISHARQLMLVNSFSFLPIWMASEEGDGWYLLADRDLACLLRADQESRKHWLRSPIEVAIGQAKLDKRRAQTCSPEDPVECLLKQMQLEPFLVVDKERPNALLGILTSYDLL